jgi:hypothetical protein
VPAIELAAATHRTRLRLIPGPIAPCGSTGAIRFCSDPGHRQAGCASAEFRQCIKARQRKFRVLDGRYAGLLALHRPSVPIVGAKPGECGIFQGSLRNSQNCQQHRVRLAGGLGFEPRLAESESDNLCRHAPPEAPCRHRTPH